MRIGAGDQHRRHVEDVGGQPCRRQRAGSNWPVGTSTLPPRCPHFFSARADPRSGRRAAPASIIDFISSNAFSAPPKPASASATIGTSQSMSPRALRPLDLVGAQERVVEPPHHRRHAVRRIEALVGIGRLGRVRVARHLPAREVDRLQTGAHHLHGLASGQRAEGHDRLRALKQPPETLRPEPRNRMLGHKPPPETEDVFGRLSTQNTQPTCVLKPTAL